MHQQVVRLDLSLNDFEDDAETAAALTALLQAMPGLKEIVLDDNELGDTVAASIAHALPQATASLRSISLVGNVITGKGATAVQEALCRADVACESIDLNSNEAALGLLTKGTGSTATLVSDLGAACLGEKSEGSEDRGGCSGLCVCHCHCQSRGLVCARSAVARFEAPDGAGHTRRRKPARVASQRVCWIPARVVSGCWAFEY